jgi:lipopolysaccharide export system protein LptA
MKNRIFHYLILPVFTTAFIFASGIVSAQGLSFFQPTKGTDKKRSGKTPTVITSDTMDIDISKNIATFTGNVKVDDEEMNISCKKMTIFLEDKKAGENVKASTTKPDAVKPDAVKPDAVKPELAKPDAVNPDEVKPEESKQVSRIICEENVVIIRKSLSESEKGQGEQKALAGHADYDVKTGKIVLTKNNPVLKRGGDTLRGEIITIWRDSEKVEVQAGEIKMNPNLPEPQNDVEKVKENKPEDKK